MSTSLSPKVKLAAGRLYADDRMAYFGSALLSLVPVWLPKGLLKTFGITENYILYCDEEAIAEWTVQETGGVLLHEIGHPLREHAKRFEKLIGTVPDFEDWQIRKAWNWAADAEINDDLRAADIKLPGEGVYPETFGSEPGKLAEEYFQIILNQARNCPRCGQHSKGKGSGGNQQQQGGSSGQQQSGGQQKNKGKGKSQGKGGQQQDKDGSHGHCPLCEEGEPGAGGGWCGSGAGRPLPNEPKTPDKDDDGNDTGRSEADIDSIRRATAEAIRDAVEKNRGTVPAGLVRWADTILQPVKIDWRTKLAQIARNAVAYRPGAVDFNYQRPSRRQGALGYGIGHPILPTLRQPTPRVGLAVDTSGSMSRDDLMIACSEAEGILKAVGADIDFVACDAAVGKITKVNSVQELAANLVGGGGTDFGPAIEAAANLRPMPEVLVYATDGHGPAPAEPPKGMHVIWLLVGNGHAESPWFPADPWGDIVEVDLDREAEAA